MARSLQYEYKQNSNLVLQADTRLITKRFVHRMLDLSLVLEQQIISQAGLVYPFGPAKIMLQNCCSHSWLGLKLGAPSDAQVRVPRITMMSQNSSTQISWN